MSVTGLVVDFLRSDVDVSAVVGDRVFDNKVPEDAEYPFLWMQLTAAEDIDTLRGQLDPMFRLLDVEAVGIDIIEAQDLRDMVSRKLTSVTAGPFGGSQAQGTIAGIRQVDHSDEYVPRNTGRDEGVVVAETRVRLVNARE